MDIFGTFDINFHLTSTHYIKNQFAHFEMIFADMEKA